MYALDQWFPTVGPWTGAGPRGFFAGPRKISFCCFFYRLNRFTEAEKTKLRWFITQFLFRRHIAVGYVRGWPGDVLAPSNHTFRFIAKALRQISQDSEAWKSACVLLPFCMLFLINRSKLCWFIMQFLLRRHIGV